MSKCTPAKGKALWNPFTGKPQFAATIFSKLLSFQSSLHKDKPADMADKKKAQDIFNETDFLFGKKTSFEKAYPGVEKVTVTVNETGYGVHQWTNPRTFQNSTISEFINCSNPSCFGGGFRLGTFIYKMVSDKHTHLEEQEFCRGNEGTKTKKGRSCINRFKIAIDIQYKNEEIADTSKQPIE